MQFGQIDGMKRLGHLSMTRTCGADAAPDGKQVKENYEPVNRPPARNRTRSGSRRSMTPVFAIGSSQVLAMLAVLSFLGERFGMTVVTKQPFSGIEQAAALVFAVGIVFGGTGYAALNSGHDRPIARTFLAFLLYLTTVSAGFMVFWITGNNWFAVLPLIGSGLVLAVALQRGSPSRTLMRIAVPSVVGGFVVSLRNIADSYWSIPTPDWTLTIIVSLLLAFWIVSRVEASAGRSPQSVDPGPGPIRV
jgi:hypothetical protein